MSLDPFAALKARARDRKNPNHKLDGLKYAAARARAPFDREVWLNVAFYLGHQYVQWNPDELTLAEIRVPGPRRRLVRPVANKIQHFVHQTLTMVLQDRPSVDILPATDDPMDIGHASVTRAYAQYLTEPAVTGFDRKLSDAVLWAILGGEAYLKWIYNPRLRRPDILACSPLDVYVDPYATSFQSARYVIHEQFMDREQVYDIWGKEVRHETQLDPIKADIQRQMGMAPMLSGVVVSELWMMPCKRYPRGLYAVWTGREQLVEPQDFPYDHKRLPFTQIGVVPSPSGLHYLTPVSSLRSPQMELNNYHAQRIMTRQNFANPKWFIPAELELEADPDDSPGQILRARASSVGLEPRIIQPSYMADNNDGEWIRREMQDIVGLHEVSQGQVPGRVEAAKAIELLRESDISRVATLNETIKSAISEGFWQLLQLARQFVPDEQIVQVYSREGLPEVKRFRSDVIRPGMRVRVTMGTGLARTRAAREDQLLNYWDRGILTDPDKVAQLLDMPEPSFYEPHVFDLRLARNENLEMAKGVAITPNSWDNHELHLREHNNFRKTVEYQMLDQESKDKFEFHCRTHEELEIVRLSRELERLQLAQQVAAMRQQMNAGAVAAPPGVMPMGAPEQPPATDGETEEMEAIET